MSEDIKPPVEVRTPEGGRPDFNGNLPKMIVLFEDDVQALYNVLKFHYINYENQRAHELVKKFQEFLESESNSSKNELDS